jgi:hypothetical protein
MFRKLCGNQALKNVILATTHWNEVPTATGKARERELIQDDRFWGKLIKAGSKVLRLDQDRESALSVLRETARNAKVTLQAQQDMVEREAPLVLTYLSDPGRVSNGADRSHENRRPQAYNGRRRHDSVQSGNNSAGRSQWYLEKLRQQQEATRRWEAELVQMRERADRQNVLLDQAKKDAEKERIRAEGQRKQRLDFYKSHVCRCKLIGKPRCASCGKMVTDVSRVFYRKTHSHTYRPCTDWRHRLLFLWRSNVLALLKVWKEMRRCRASANAGDEDILCCYVNDTHQLYTYIQFRNHEVLFLA